MSAIPQKQIAIEYPDSDGMPMADNTLQYKWMVTIEGNLELMFLGDPNVFVAGDLLWYPVEGDNKTRLAPDALVVFGRPKGRRGSYRQWDEAGIPPQVVFEVLAPGNRPGEMMRKLNFYDRFGVKEFYQYDPDYNVLDGWHRVGDKLAPIERMNGWISPLLGIRFELTSEDFVIYRPDGERFLTFTELGEERARMRHEIEEARKQIDEQRRQADEQGRQADEQRQQADEQRQRADALAAKLREMGIDPDSI
jgi:Uma2 family endonuclease